MSRSPVGRLLTLVFAVTAIALLIPLKAHAAPPSPTDRLLLFGRGTDNALWYTSSPDGITWADWTSLGGSILNDPDAASDPKGNIYVVARQADDSIGLIRRVNGKWTAWSKVPTGGTNASPAIVLAKLYGGDDYTYYGRLLFLAVRSALNNELAYNVYDPKKGVWGNWIGLGGVLTGGPDVAFYPPNSVLMHVRGTDATVKFRGLKWNPAPEAKESFLDKITGAGAPFTEGGGFGWSNWATLDNKVLGAHDLSTSQTSDGRLQLWAVSNAGTLLMKEFDGSMWHQWTDYGGHLSSAVDAASFTKGSAEVFGRGDDGRMWQLHFGPGGKKGWNPVGNGTFAKGAGPAVVAAFDPTK